MLNERQQKLFTYIRQLNRPVTIEQLASYFTKSERTIRNDLKILQLWGSSQGIPIHVKNSIVHLDEETIQQLLIQSAIQNGQESMASSPLTRQLFITLSLLMSDETKTLSDLAVQYHTSKSTVASDMKSVMEWLKPLNIQLNSNKQGYFIEVNELQRRVAMVNCLEWLEHSYMSTESFHTVSWANLSHRNMQQMEQLYQAMMSQLPQSQLPLYAILLVQYERIKHGVEIEGLLFDSISVISTKEHVETAQLIRQLYQQLGLILSNEELAFTLLMLALYSGNVDQQVKSLNQFCISDYLHQLQIQLSLTSFDHETQSLLDAELNKLLLWQQYGLKMVHPLYLAVQDKYQVIYHVLQQASVIDVKWQEIPMPMWTNMVLLLAGELELQQTQGQKIRAVLVCPNGSATSYFLEKKLQRYFQNIEIVDKRSVEEVQSSSETDYDIIISTVLMKEKNRRIIVIPPILDEKQLEILRNFIRNVEEKKQMEISQLESIFPNNAIAYMENAKSIEQLLTLGFEILETNGYVQPVVKEELLAAYEKFGLYFEILPGVIMPHVLSPNVNKAGLSCICLKEPFVIHGKEIQTVITLVSPNEKEHVQLLQLLYELVSKTKSGFELNSIIEKRDKTYAT